MDSIENQLIIRLKEKIETVIAMLEKSEEERNKLQKEKFQLSVQLKLKATAFEELERRFETLKLARAMLASGENSHDARIRVNRIVREIDKCIALLNH